MSGPMILLLHGFPEGWLGWRRQIESLAAAGYFVVAPDQRGDHLSAKPSSVADYKIDEMVKDALGLMDAYERKQAFVVGHDWGAGVAWCLADQHPDRIKKM